MNQGGWLPLAAVCLSEHRCRVATPLKPEVGVGADDHQGVASGRPRSDFLFCRPLDLFDCLEHESEDFTFLARHRKSPRVQGKNGRFALPDPSPASFLSDSPAEWQCFRASGKPRPDLGSGRYSEPGNIPLSEAHSHGLAESVAELHARSGTAVNDQGLAHDIAGVV